MVAHRRRVPHRSEGAAMVLPGTGYGGVARKRDSRDDNRHSHREDS